MRQGTILLANIGRSSNALLASVSLKPNDLRNFAKGYVGLLLIGYRALSILTGEAATRAGFAAFAAEHVDALILAIENREFERAAK